MTKYERYSTENIAQQVAFRIMATQRIIDIMLEDEMINNEDWLIMSQRAQTRESVAEQLRALIKAVDYEEDPLSRLAVTYIRTKEAR